MATLFLIVKRFQDAGIEASACALKHRQYVTYLRRAQYYAWFKQVSTCQSYSNGGAKDQSQWRRPSLPVARGVRLNNEQMCMTCERLKPGGLAARVPIWHTPCQAARLKTIQDGQEKVISYAGRTLAAGEKHFCVTRKELLAVVYFLKYYKQYLLGRELVKSSSGPITPRCHGCDEQRSRSARTPGG